MIRRKSTKWLCLLLTAFVIIVMAGLGIYTAINAGRLQNQPGTGKSPVEVKVLGQNFTSLSITDEKTAVSAARDADAQLGYQNALRELQVADQFSVFGDCYYKLQQYYQGIPVYGNFVIICAEDSGTAKSMITAVQDISEDFSAKPKLDEIKARETAIAYFRENGAANTKFETIASENPLCIYPLEDGTHTLAYRIIVSMAKDTLDGVYETLIDASNGKVLSVQETVNEMSVQTYSSDKSITVNASYDETAETYFLFDEERGIYVHRFNQGDSSDQDVASVQDVSNGYLIRTDKVREDGTPDFGKEYDEGIYFLQTLTQIYDYFDEALDGENGLGVLHANYNDSYNQGKNARGGVNGGEGFISFGKVTGTQHLDAIVHEYTHYITNSITSIGGEDGKSIREGISDIFACLAEEKIEGSTDWKIEIPQCDVYRNMADPSDSGNAETVTDKNSEDITHHTEAYYYSTLISHTAYLMRQGMDEEGSGAISGSELAELWYRTILMLPSRCSYEDCRAIAELAAEHMAKSGKLDAFQLSCVAWAFEEVGIDWSLSPVYTATENTEIIIYDINGAPYEDYSISVKNVSEQTSSEETVYRHESGQQPPKIKDLIPENGSNQTTYLMKVTDHQVQENATYFYVEVSDSGQEVLEIYSCFGEYEFTPEEIADAMEEAANFAYGWFWDNQHVDHNDKIYSKELFNGTLPYERVTEKGIVSKEDVMKLTQQYYTPETSEQLMSQKMWLEQDEALYVSASEGLGGGVADSVEIQVQKENNDQYTITVYEYLNGEPLPWGPSSYEIHYKKVNGYWVFDRYLLPVESIKIREIENLEQYQAFSDKLDQVYAHYQDDVSIYSVYDMDGDGCKELLIKEGTAEFNFRWNVYVYDEKSGGCRRAGDFDGGHSNLFACQHGGVYNVIPSGEEVSWIDLEKGAVVKKEVQTGTEAMKPFMEEETIPWAQISDTRLLADSL